MADIDNLVIKISSDASEAVKGIKDLARGLRETADECSKAAKSLDGVVKSTKDAGKASAEAADSVKKVSEANQGFAKLSDSVKKYATQINKASAVSKTFKNIFSGAGGILKTIGRGALVPIKAVGKAIGESFGKIGTVFSAIKRIAFYRLIRSAIKMVTQALKEGISNLVAWDKTIANTSHAAETMERLKSTALLVKNSLGAMAMPIIQILTPALEALANAVVKVINVINQMFRAFQGYGTYIKAIQKTTDSAASSAKALQKVLFGFDELNKTWSVPDMTAVCAARRAAKK